MDDKWRSNMSDRMDDMETLQTELKTAIDENTAMTTQVRDNTEEMVELFKTMKGGLKILAALGTVAKWISAVSAAGAVVWLATKGWAKS